MSWPLYKEWVADRLPLYRLVQADEDTLVFSRTTEGDSFRLTLQRNALTGQQPRLVVQASFRAVAF